MDFCVNASKPLNLESEVSPRVSGVEIAREVLFVLSVPLRETRYPEGVTTAEREIIDLLLDGSTPEEVGELRAASMRTITTQLARIYQKAGVASMRQLAAFTSGVDGPWTE
jgi:DNA-binding NarL/FixJ family response regulator